MNKVYIITGKYNVEAFEYEEYENIDIDFVHKFEFNTTDEKGAFCKGVQLTARYEDYTFIDEDEYEMLVNL